MPVPGLQFPLFSFLGLNPIQESPHMLQKTLAFLLQAHSVVAKWQIDVVADTGLTPASWWY